MRRHSHHAPHHESPQEQRLREIVDELVPDDSQKQAYLAFAHELMAAERHAPFGSVIPRERGDPRNLAAMETRRDPSIGGAQRTVGTSGVTKGRDPSQRTKRIAAKWFERGLHGHLLWLVGQAVIQERPW
jgi:hypothetical protein